MSESERPERNPGDYDPAEDPDTDAPASGERTETDDRDRDRDDVEGDDDDGEIPTGQAEPDRDEPLPGGPPTAPADPPSAG